MSAVHAEEAQAHVAACCVATLGAALVDSGAACVFASVTWVVVLFWQAQGELP